MAISFKNCHIFVKINSMKKSIIILLLFMAVGAVQSQKISNVDFDFVKEYTTDSTSSFYYPLLESRLLSLDTTLDSDAYELLYYGHVFTEKYHPYNRPDEMDSMRLLMKSHDYEEALVFGWKLYNDDPVSLNVNYHMMICYHHLGKKDTARIFARNYYSFLGVIYRSGDGESVKTAYVVTNISDEYQLLGDMGLNMKSQALIDGPCDLMTVTADKDTPKEFRDIKKVYFNISKPFETLSRMFKE